MWRRAIPRLAATSLLGLTTLAVPILSAADRAPAGVLHRALIPPARAESAQPTPARPHPGQRPDVLVTATNPLCAATIAALVGLTAGTDQAVPVRVGRLRLGGAVLTAWGVDPARFRIFTPALTAASDGVWAALLGGDLVVAHAPAAALHLPLGGDVAVADAVGGPARPLRLGALATSGLPGVAVLVSDATASTYGLPAANAVVLSAGAGDPRGLALAPRRWWARRRASASSRRRANRWPYCAAGRLDSPSARSATDTSPTARLRRTRRGCAPTS